MIREGLAGLEGSSCTFTTPLIRRGCLSFPRMHCCIACCELHICSFLQKARSHLGNDEVEVGSILKISSFNCSVMTGMSLSFFVKVSVND